MNLILRSQLALLWFGLSVLFLSSCKRNPEVVPASIPPVSSTITAGAVADKEVNDWILENMSYFYLWEDKLPTNPDKTQTPDKFFSSLLYDRNNTANPNRDRFSFIQQSADELKASSNGATKTTGIEYRIYYRDQGQTSVYGLVVYVIPNSPADQAGVKRGDIFVKVDNQYLTKFNYSILLNTNADSFAFTFTQPTATNELIEVRQPKLIQAIIVQEDPVLLDTIYTLNGRTIGYVVYNQFVSGPNGSSVNSYDLKLDNIFAKFKQKGVNELILDLRYNRGGYISSALNLASLIGKDINNKVFFWAIWNSKIKADRDKKYGVGKWEFENFVVKPQNIGENLNKVYVLTTGSTASASELVINGLKPFMNVVTIGSTTVGKNVGSLILSDVNNKIKWGIRPITLKTANALGFSDYGDGFAPLVQVEEPSFVLPPLGSLKEPLLAEAIYQITGTRTARRATISAEGRVPSPGSSLDRKAGGGNMFLEKF